jgi:threonine aldolase
LPGADGKLTAEQIEAYVKWQAENDSAEHIVQPGMVYVSSPTELGTIYKKEELEKISQVCHKYGLYLFLDGARLGYGLECPENDLSLEDLARLCDVFYIGGTKVGALFGEAVVISNDSLKRDFRYHIKQRGGMLAKGRLLGLQFCALFEDDLYFEISAHAISLAVRLREAFEEMGLSFLVDSPTNQLFVILPDDVCEKLAENFAFECQERVDDSHTAVRFCTCWATREDAVEQLICEVRKLLEE